MTFRGSPLSRSLLGVKRTLLFAAHMSAFDPKRTWRLQCEMSASDPKRTLANTASVRLYPVTGSQIHDAARKPQPSLGSWNDMSKDTLYGRGPHTFGVVGTIWLHEMSIC